MLIYYNNKTYDIPEEFVAKHPGGTDILCSYANKDCTKVFDEIHSTEAFEMLSQYEITGTGSANNNEQVHARNDNHLSIWKKLSMMETKHIHRNTAMIFLGLCIILQIRFWMNTFSYEMKSFPLVLTCLYGILGVFVPITAFIIFRDKLHNTAFDATKGFGNTNDTVIVNIFFQLTYVWMFFTCILSSNFCNTLGLRAWLRNNRWCNKYQILLKYLTGYGPILFFDFYVSKTLKRQSIRRDSLFQSAQLNKITSLLFLVGKWMVNVFVIRMCFGDITSLYFEHSIHSIFNFPIYMFIYTLRMKRILNEYTYEITMMTLTIYNIIMPSLTLLNYGISFEMAVMIMILVKINMSSNNKLFQHIMLNILAPLSYVLDKPHSRTLVSKQLKKHQVVLIFIMCMAPVYQYILRKKFRKMKILHKQVIDDKILLKVQIPELHLVNPNYFPGMHCKINIDGDSRSYTPLMVEKRDQQYEIEFYIKSYPTGNVSEKIYNNIQFQLTGFYGVRHLANFDKTKTLLFVSCGTGITPFASILNSDNAELISTEKILLHCGAAEKQIFEPKFNLQNTTRHWFDHENRLTADKLHEIVKGLNYQAYVCGTSDFNDFIHDEITVVKW